MLDLEQGLLSEELSIPIYFANATAEVMEIHDNIQRSTTDDTAGSASQALLGAVLGSGYQMAVYGSQSKAITDVQIANIIGRLQGAGADEQLPTITLVAHYDALGLLPDMSFGADSNASGIAALLELLRLFSRLASSSGGAAGFNLLFVATGAGKYNYFGSKRFLDDQQESDNSWMQESLFTLCLDSLGLGQELNLHVSKPPKENSAGSRLFDNLKAAGSSYPGVEVDMVHKKINLAEELLAWEHERYSIRKLPAFTLSHFKSHREQQLRGSITDDNIDIAVLARNVKIVAESLAKMVYNVQNDVFENDLAVSEEHLQVTMEKLTSQPRSAQLIAKKHNSVVTLIEGMVRHYAKQVKVQYFSPDKRDPEVVFYDATKATMNAYTVKPAVFDLVLTFMILAYVGTFALAVKNFNQVKSLLSWGTKQKVK
uniref:BOS complex subunit NCLN n=1 Tax=Lynceus sp. MCZ IZ 141354 TaxID=1930659 RepID=A0A9N6ZFF6_9CRUS|nr:EOG090X02MW [Lynceus sp. MCZ IZ 141354]